MYCFLVLLFLSLMAVNAQPPLGQASTITCGNVDIPPMTPAQIVNPLSWSLPGQIAASNCYTGFLQGSHQALNDMYNAMYAARPPANINANNPTGTVTNSGRGSSGSSRPRQPARSKKNNDGKSSSKSKKENDSSKKTKDGKDASKSKQ